MFIDVLTTFRDGHTTYHAGDHVHVSDEDAARFCGYGWATAGGATAPAPTGTTVDLQIHSGQIGQISEVI